MIQDSPLQLRHLEMEAGSTRNWRPIAGSGVRPSFAHLTAGSSISREEASESKQQRKNASISRWFRPSMNQRTILIWLRSYTIAAGLIVLGFAMWKFNLFIHTPRQGGWDTNRVWGVATNFGPYLVYAVLLLSPWWRLGNLICSLGYAIILPSCIYVTLSLFVVDVLYYHEQIWFHLLLLTAFVAELFLLLLPLAATPAEIQAANLRKQRLAPDDQDDSDLVEEIIVGIEGAMEAVKDSRGPNED